MVLLIFIIQTKSESRTVSTRVKFNRVISKKDVTGINLFSDNNSNNEMNSFNGEPRKCDELSPVILNEILGAAFNSRCVLDIHELSINLNF